ncbi:MAG: hypothetical protein ACYC9O_02630 [Candidatus Latescibacterota bacterium]
MKEKNWSEVTRLLEEDLALVSSSHSIRGMDKPRFTIFLVMSTLILAIYLSMSYSFYPGYPVVTPKAEQNKVYAENYPPFRMDEWSKYSITRDILEGTLSGRDSFVRKHPAGFAAASVPLTAIWGKAGPYFTNAFILWASALMFFFLLMKVVSFSTAVGATLLLALATPNLFYASSAFAEPLGQLLLLLAIFLFVRGTSARRQWMLFFPAGFIAGLTLFVQPLLAGIIIPFIIFLALENTRKVWQDRGALALAGGFAVPLLAYMITGVLLTGDLFPFLFGFPYSPYNLLSHRPLGAEPHLMLGIWELLVSSPHGLVALMPIIMLVPAGFIAMWRGGYPLLAGIAGSVIVIVLVFAADGGIPITGESVGARQLIPVLPLLIFPLAFLWEEGIGERVWIGVLAAFTIYMSGLGWWAGSGALAETLQDRSARSIMLSRKNMIETPVFKTSGELVSRFTHTLREHDITRWLKTLAPASRKEITGIEREVFESLSRRSRYSGNTLSEYIVSADSTIGIQLLIPNLIIEEIEQERKDRGTP